MHKNFLSYILLSKSWWHGVQVSYAWLFKVAIVVPPKNVVERDWKYLRVSPRSASAGVRQGSSL